MMAAELQRAFESNKASSELVDLREHPLPFCDGGAAYGHPNVAALGSRIKAARVLIVATPVYNYDVNAAAKNLLELTGSAWDGKIVGFLCAAGGDSSYMSVMAFAQSLMLDFRCVILPRFVYATDEHFGPDGITDARIVARIRDLAAAAIRLRND